VGLSPPAGTERAPRRLLTPDGAFIPAGVEVRQDGAPEGIKFPGAGAPCAPQFRFDPFDCVGGAEAGDEFGDRAAEGALQQAFFSRGKQVAIDLAAGARYRATGKRKTAIARVTLRPGQGSYTINGRTLAEFFPRETLQRNIRQPLETVGYEERMDVIARLHGGGVSAQAGALRHGISRALLEAEPNLRGELKRRGFLTRDARAKERKKAGLKKARKRPQFSKR